MRRVSWETAYDLLYTTMRYHGRSEWPIGAMATIISGQEWGSFVEAVNAMRSLINATVRAEMPPPLKMRLEYIPYAESALMSSQNMGDA